MEFGIGVHLPYKKVMSFSSLYGYIEFFFSPILLSVPFRILFMFSLCRQITITGTKTAAISSGQRFVKLQSVLRKIQAVRAMGKTTEAAIEAREMYRQIQTHISHTAKATATAIV